MKIKKILPRLYVLNDPTVLRIIPALAAKIGLNESIVLMQIDYLKSISNTESKKGRPWTYQSIRALREGYFPFWSIATINRIIESLQKHRLIRCDNFNKAAYDKTRWMSLNYGKISRLGCVMVSDGVSQNETRSAQNETPIPETTTKTTTNKKANAAKAAPYYKETCEIFDKGFEKLESAKYAWSAKDGKAVKEIIGKAIRSTGVDQACMEIILEIKKRAAALYRDIEANRQAKLRGGKHNDYMARKKFTPQNLNSLWNDYPTAKVPQTAIEITGGPDIPAEELKRHREAAGWS